MIANSFYHRSGTAVPDSKSFSCNSGDKNFSTGSTIEYCISNDDILIRFKGGTLGRNHDNLATGQTFSQIVVGVTLQVKFYTGNQEGSKALSGRSCKSHF